MPGPDPNEYLMQQAWKRLWVPGTPYYLPTAIAKGAQGNGVTVNALDQIQIADTGEIPLVSSSTWGNISVDLSDATVGGLDTMTNGGMTYDTATGAFSATVAIGGATFTGSYAVSGSGVVGCAVESAGGVLKVLSSPGEMVRDEVGNGADLALAASYRDQLALSDAGLAQVAAYYDNNDTLNEVVSGQNGPNTFTQAWPVYEPTGPGKNSAYFAAQTSTAAQNPFNPSSTVGDPDYSIHSFTMQGILLKVLLALSTQDGDRYHQAAQAMLAFKQQVVNQPAGPVMVGKVMNTLGTTPPTGVQGSADPAQLDTAQLDTAEPLPWSEIVARADAFVEESYERWEREAAVAKTQWDEELANSSTGISGRFSDGFSVPSATLTGTVQVVGVSPNTSLQVALTGLDARVPGIVVHLSGSGGLLDEAQNAIARASWFQNLLTKKVHDRLGQADLLTWLTDRINQSITQALGSFGDE